MAPAPNPYDPGWEIGECDDEGLPPADRRHDAAFCHGITEALALGWKLCCPPALAYDNGRAALICRRAVMKQVPDLDDGPSFDLSGLESGAP